MRDPSGAANEDMLVEELLPVQVRNQPADEPSDPADADEPSDLADESFELPTVSNELWDQLRAAAFANNRSFLALRGFWESPGFITPEQKIQAAAHFVTLAKHLKDICEWGLVKLLNHIDLGLKTLEAQKTRASASLRKDKADAEEVLAVLDNDTFLLLDADMRSQCASLIRHVRQEKDFAAVDGRFQSKHYLNGKLRDWPDDNVMRRSKEMCTRAFNELQNLFTSLLPAEVFSLL